MESNKEYRRTREYLGFILEGWWLLNHRDCFAPDELAFFPTTCNFLHVFWLIVCPDCFLNRNAKVLAVAYQVPELPVMPLGLRVLNSAWAS